jgi:hypothetical protein
MSKYSIISYPFFIFSFSWTLQRSKPQPDILVVGFEPKKVYRSDHIYLPYSADRSCDKSLSQSVILHHTCFYVYITYSKGCRGCYSWSFLMWPVHPFTSIRPVIHPWIQILYKTDRNISSCAQYMTMQKHFSHPSFVVYFFATPTYKTEMWTANRWGTTNSKPPGPIIIMKGPIRNTLSASSHITFITPFHQPLQSVQFHWVKLACFWLFFIQFYFAGSHIEHSCTCSEDIKTLWIQILGLFRVFPTRGTPQGLTDMGACVWHIYYHFCI